MPGKKPLPVKVARHRVIRAALLAAEEFLAFDDPDRDKDGLGADILDRALADYVRAVTAPKPAVRLVDEPVDDRPPCQEGRCTCG